MKRSTRLVILISLGSAGACVAAVMHFLLTLSRNKLPWLEADAVRDHYLVVGQFYTQGFAVGFFLCFSLTVAAVATNQWWERRRRIARSDRSPGPRPAPAATPRPDDERRSA